jgi:chromosome segregation ATPase
MSNPTIDFDQIADGVTAVLNACAHGAQRVQLEAEAQRVAEAQRESEAARAQQIANIRGEFTRISAMEKAVKAEIDQKFGQYQPLAHDLSRLSAEHNQLLSQLARMREQHPFLKG